MSLASISQAGNIFKNNIEISSLNSAGPGIVVGETLEATVLEKLAGNKYTLIWKNFQTSATSNIALNAGEKLLLKVESLQPQIVLNILDNKNQNISAQINEKLLQWRINPESLVQAIDKFSGLAKLLQLADLPSAISRSDIENLIKLFDNIVFSSRTKSNPLFLKEFVSKIGLLTENSLEQIFAGTVGGRIEKPQEDNLKMLLLKISSSINNILQEKSKLDVDNLAKLVKIASFTEDSLKAIEIKQVINSVFQASDNGLMLQIPVALAGEVFCSADIFITPQEKNDRGEKKFSSCNVAIFLDLDVLGKIAVKANFHDGGISCLIKCEREEIRNLIDTNIDGLKNSLVKTGYRVDYIDCIQEENIKQKKEEFLSKQSFYVDHLINFFV